VYFYYNQLTIIIHKKCSEGRGGRVITPNHSWISRCALQCLTCTHIAGALRYNIVYKTVRLGSITTTRVLYNQRHNIRVGISVPYICFVTICRYNRSTTPCVGHTALRTDAIRHDFPFRSRVPRTLGNTVMFGRAHPFNAQRCGTINRDVFC
jgi:hypothetical protein